MSSSGTDLGFEAELFKAADKLRGNLEPSEYKHIALGLIFLKYISDAFEHKRTELETEDYADPEDPEEYLAERVFWVPKEARWDYLKANARARDLEITDALTGKQKKVGIGGLIDNAMEAIEKANPTTLKEVLPKDYGSQYLDSIMLGDLIMLFSDIGMHDGKDKSRDLLGRAYEYFLSEFAGIEGKRGGEFFTPRSVVRVLVEMLEPYEGRVYDPCCGSGGMFVQSEEFVESHGGRPGQIAVYGQERNPTTWKLARMNLAVRGIDADIAWNNGGSFIKDAHPMLKADYILANPPFNISDWWRPSLEGDARWQFGTPPEGNANFAWLSHIYHHLAPRGSAAVVLANGSMSSQTKGEGDIRKAMIEADAVDCMVALPGQMFYSTQIPVCLWFLARAKSANGHRDRQGETLFIDARNMGYMVNRTTRAFSDDDMAKITGAYHSWRAKPERLEELGLETYIDEPGFCKSANLELIQKHDYVLTPGRYVGAAALEDDGVPFEERIAGHQKQLERYFAIGNDLQSEIIKNFSWLKS